MNIKNTTTLILEKVENLLLEGRLEDVKAKYPEPTWGEIDRLAKIDPSGNQKYLEWLTKNMLTRTIKWFKDNAKENPGYYGWSIDQTPDTAEDTRWYTNNNFRRSMTSINNENLLKVADDIDYFHKNPSKYEKKDINQYDSIDDLEKASNDAKLKLSRKEQKDTGVDKVYEDDDFLVLMPKTHKASCRYGSNTKWCVTMRNTSNYFENYFTQGPIFFLVDKRKLEPTKSMDTPTYYKVAIHYKPFKGALYRGSNTALRLTAGKTKEEFVNGANLENSVIDYWNVVDNNKPESVVKKYLGGPGKGQTKKGEETIAKLKSLMEKYTKEYLGKFYDSLGDSKNILDKVTKKQDEIAEKTNKKYNLEIKISRINQLKFELSRAINNFSQEEDSEQYEWLQTQKDKAEFFYDQLSYKSRELQNEINVIEVELDSLNGELKNKDLVFYYPEKHISLTR
jgi:hypothetical protein